MSVSEDGKENSVGCRGADPANNIELSGLEIEQKHCTISNNGGTVLVQTVNWQ